MDQSSYALTAFLYTVSDGSKGVLSDKVACHKLYGISRGPKLSGKASATVSEPVYAISIEREGHRVVESHSPNLPVKNIT